MVHIPFLWYSESNNYGGVCMNTSYITVAAQNSTDDFRQAANYVCTGKHDELTIQKAIDDCIRTDKNLYFYNGVYHIDGFCDFGDGGPHTALCFPNAHREIRVIGENHEYGFQQSFRNGVVLYVAAEALGTISDAGADVLRSTWTPFGIQNGANLHIENLAVVLANNQHPIRCIDLRRTDRVEVKNVSLISYGEELETVGAGLSIPPSVPAIGCIGLTMTDGSNYDYSNYINVQAWGFDEGIQVGGEHVVCINCGAAIGRYGFTFGNYASGCGSNHPITLINCLDERNIHLPYFGKWCGDNATTGERLIGEQEVTLISFNIERVEKQTPGGKLGDLMREEIPGTWKGNIDFTAQCAWNSTNSKDFQLWENDGSGSGIKTRNNCHKTVCTTAERLSYYPTLGQQIFDTDLNKMVICIDPQQKKWVDFNGNAL